MLTESILKVTDENFEDVVRSTDQPVLVEFGAQWCAPCRMLAPVLDELAQQFQGSVTVATVDVDASPQTTGQLGITSIPTSVLYKDGQEINRFVGLRPKHEFKLAIDEALASKG